MRPAAGSAWTQWPARRVTGWPYRGGTSVPCGDDLSETTIPRLPEDPALDRLFRRPDQAATQERETDDERRLQPLRVFTRDLEVSGWVPPADERMTDILQRGEELAFLPEGADPDDHASWMVLSPRSVLLVVPPPHVSPPEKRLHRQTQQVVIRVGQYVVSGTAYLRPGYEQDLFLRATQPFLPLTAAVVAGPMGQTAYEVVIVNLGEVEELREA
jgi:hypothetical protein